MSADSHGLGSTDQGLDLVAEFAKGHAPSAAMGWRAQHPEDPVGLLSRMHAEVTHAIACRKRPLRLKSRHSHLSSKLAEDLRVKGRVVWGRRAGEAIGEPVPDHSALY